ncbi:casein kinase II subunit beta [Nematocida major]|uniref:casein kinase II subunit beta n=1 Tax=Nematocida major TaxID=1912982 RepID=UPI0020086950|nr:casein kinase II subunit beta [Nematocida major]KAH9386610.1 casein kinase II subunit beta [Nematocida major]
MLISSSEEYETSSSSLDWVDRFVHGFADSLIVRVDQPFIDDPFNLFGLSEHIKGYDKLIRVLRGEEYEPHSHELTVSLYYMIHQRYIVSKKGLEAMHSIISSGVFGKCKRVFCNGFPFIPIGLNEKPNRSTAKLFCDQCKQIYEPTNELGKIDGCAFGPTFPHLFILMYRNLFPKRRENIEYNPRIFGFRVASAKKE